MAKALLSGNSLEATINHWDKMHDFATRCYALSNDIEESVTEVEIKGILQWAPTLDEDLHNVSFFRRARKLLIYSLRSMGLHHVMSEKTEYPTLWTYLWSASGARRSTHGPTANHLQSLENARRRRKS